MASHNRRWLIAGLLITALLSSACDPLMLSYFLIVGLDPKRDPECLIFKNRKDSKVVILASAPVDTQLAAFVHADRELYYLFAQQLQANIAACKDKIRIAAPAKVLKYLEDHPNWQALDPADIGKDLDADYVIYLEIDKLSLYEEGSRNELFRGKAEIAVKVFDCTKPGEPPVFQKEYATVYPRSKGAIPVSDTSLQAFKFSFMKRVSTDLSWLFAGHSTTDDYTCD